MVRTAAVFAAALAFTLPANAGAEPAILVLELESSGIDRSVAHRLDAAMREEIRALAGNGFHLLPKPALDFEGLKLAAGCIDEGTKCLRVIAETLGAAKILQSSISGSAKRARVAFVLVDSSGPDRQMTAELLDVDVQSAPEFRAWVAAAFGVKRPLPRGGIALYNVGSIGKLSGAEVLLDDQPTAVDALREIEPGEHRLEVRQKGFESFIWIGAVRPGRTERVEVRFEPAAARADIDASSARELRPEGSGLPNASATEVPRAEGQSHVASWVFGGGAVAAAAVAGFYGLQVLDRNAEAERMQSDLSEACHRDSTCNATCEGANPPEICRQGAQAALISNISWAVSGALAVGAVVAYFVEGSGTAVSGAVVPAADGASVSVTGRF